LHALPEELRREQALGLGPGLDRCAGIRQVTPAAQERPRRRGQVAGGALRDPCRQRVAAQVDLAVLGAAVAAERFPVLVLGELAQPRAPHLLAQRRVAVRAEEALDRLGFGRAQVA
jgi:hypothetical protein